MTNKKDSKKPLHPALDSLSRGHHMEAYAQLHAIANKNGLNDVMMKCMADIMVIVEWARQRLEKVFDGPSSPQELQDELRLTYEENLEGRLEICQILSFVTGAGGVYGDEDGMETVDWLYSFDAPLLSAWTYYEGAMGMGLKIPRIKPECTLTTLTDVMKIADAFPLDIHVQLFTLSMITKYKLCTCDWPMKPVVIEKLTLDGMLALATPTSIVYQYMTRTFSLFYAIRPPGPIAYLYSQLWVRLDHLCATRLFHWWEYWGADMWAYTNGPTPCSNVLSTAVRIAGAALATARGGHLPTGRLCLPTPLDIDDLGLKCTVLPIELSRTRKEKDTAFDRGYTSRWPMHSASQIRDCKQLCEERQMNSDRWREIAALESQLKRLAEEHKAQYIKILADYLDKKGNRQAGAYYLFCAELDHPSDAYPDPSQPITYHMAFTANRIAYCASAALARINDAILPITKPITKDELDLEDRAFLLIDSIKEYNLGYRKKIIPDEDNVDKGLVEDRLRRLVEKNSRISLGQPSTDSNWLDITYVNDLDHLVYMGTQRLAGMTVCDWQIVLKQDNDWIPWLVPGFDDHSDWVKRWTKAGHPARQIRSFLFALSLHRYITIGVSGPHSCPRPPIGSSVSTLQREYWSSVVVEGEMTARGPAVGSKFQVLSNHKRNTIAELLNSHLSFYTSLILGVVVDQLAGSIILDNQPLDEQTSTTVISLANRALEEGCERDGGLDGLLPTIGRAGSLHIASLCNYVIGCASVVKNDMEEALDYLETCDILLGPPPSLPDLFLLLQAMDLVQDATAHSLDDHHEPQTNQTFVPLTLTTNWSLAIIGAYINTVCESANKIDISQSNLVDLRDRALAYLHTGPWLSLMRSTGNEDRMKALCTRVNQLIPSNEVEGDSVDTDHEVEDKDEVLSDPEVREPSTDSEEEESEETTGEYEDNSDNEDQWEDEDVDDSEDDSDSDNEDQWEDDGDDDLPNQLPSCKPVTDWVPPIFSKFSTTPIPTTFSKSPIKPSHAPRINKFTGTPLPDNEFGLGFGVGNENGEDPNFQGELVKIPDVNSTNKYDPKSILNKELSEKGHHDMEREVKEFHEKLLLNPIYAGPKGKTPPVPAKVASLPREPVIAVPGRPVARARRRLQKQ